MPRIEHRPPCSQCGADLPALTTRCPKCGTPVVQPPSDTPPSPAQIALRKPGHADPGLPPRDDSNALKELHKPGAGPGINVGLPSQISPPSSPPAHPPGPRGGQTPVMKPGAPGRGRTVVLPLSGGVFRTTFGRARDNDVVLDHPQVSSHHAVLTANAGGLFLEDLGSSNGTFVRGRRIGRGAPTAVSPGERVYIGPWPVVLSTDSVQAVLQQAAADPWAGRPLFEIEASNLVVQVPDRNRPGETKTILNGVSFKALPGDMIALMGPSGAGKTTLLMVLNGYLPPTGDSQVRVNGEDLYAIYDNLRGVIGYVPQDDLVHPELTVFEAVRYSARFRLPPDTSDDEIERRVDATLEELGLTAQRDLEIGRPEKKVLSGGQRKRVNIAMELVTDPVILFLDEPTSGLAADDTTALLRSLSDLTRRTGKTVIMTIHQPAKDEFELFNLMLLMGPGGWPLYFGPTGAPAYEMFGRFAMASGKGPVTNPRDLFEVLTIRENQVHKELLSRDPSTPRSVAKERAAQIWHSEFYQRSNPVYQGMYTGERALGVASARATKPAPPVTHGQLRLLISRYLTVKWRDKTGTAIMLLQAPIIGALLAFVFHLAAREQMAWCNPTAAMCPGGASPSSPGAESSPDHAAALFFLVVAAVWFGTSNAAREIVGERAIYLRERMVNLKLWSYVASKYLVLSSFCLIQCSVLLLIVSWVLGFHGGSAAFVKELGIMVATSMNAVALGLLLSTVVTSTEAAMALTPIALIPQVVLGGFVVRMNESRLLATMMNAIPARWGFQGMVALERASVGECAKKAVTSEAPLIGLGMDEISDGMPPLVLYGMTVFMLLTLTALLRRRDPM